MFARTEELLRSVPEDPFSEKVDEHLLAINESRQCLACCSLWWSNCPDLEGETLACIGHFYASDFESGKTVLSEACETLRQQGATLAIGPMNGNTWRKYRFVTEANEREPFILEPRNPDWWPTLWGEIGFKSLAGYHSSVIYDIEKGDPRVERAWGRLEKCGVRIRALSKDDFRADLNRIFYVSEKSFVSNYLYTPISEEEFVQLYLPFKDFVDPRFALIAEHEGKPVGFVFCIPDLAQHQAGQACDTLIIKTLAVLPGRAYAGLGTVLVDRMREAARTLGYRCIVHALMYDGNDSANIGKNSEILRRYTLFSKSLGK